MKRIIVLFIINLTGCTAEFHAPGTNSTFEINIGDSSEVDSVAQEYVK